MPTFSFSSSNRLELALQPENGSTPLRAETSHTWTGCRKRTTIVAAEKPVTTVLWRRKTFEVQGQLVRVKKAKASTSYWKQKLFWRLGDSTYTIRGPFNNSGWNVYIGSSASTVVTELTPRDRKVPEKSKPATLMIADNFSGANTALTALILLLYSQEWYSSRDRWWHCAEGCLSEVAGGG